jgi:peroxiredoxin
MFKSIFLASLILGAGAFTRVAAQHEYAPLLESKVDYKDWTFNNLMDGKPVNLRQFAQGKKLVLVVYFAAWCPNWRLEAPVAKSLYDKYHKDGLEVIGVSEYATLEDAKGFFGAEGPPYTIVSESLARPDRQKTSHYGYRTAAGDTRNWGSPWNIFLTPATLNPKGDVLTEKAFVVNGELVEADADKFIREHLGLAAATAPTALKLPGTGPTTPCEPAKPESTTFKKP